MTGILFDLDGTLVNSIFDIGDAMNRILVRRNRKTLTYDQYRNLVGHGMNRLVADIFPEETGESLAALQREFAREYGEHVTDKTRAYGGIPELLEELARRGIPMGIFTNKSQAQADAVVSACLGEGYFRLVRGAREGLPMKPDAAALKPDLVSWNLPPEEILFVGDSAVDILTARSGGFSSCGVLWGFRERPELEEAGAEAVISSPEELLEFFPSALPEGNSEKKIGKTEVNAWTGMS